MELFLVTKGAIVEGVFYTVTFAFSNTYIVEVNVFFQDSSV